MKTRQQWVVEELESRLAPSAGLVFPGATWQMATPESQGVSSALLQQAYTDLGANAGNISVVRNGYMISSYGDPTAPVELASTSKTLTAVLSATLMQKGKLTLQTPIPYSTDPVAAAQWLDNPADRYWFDNGGTAAPPGSPLATLGQFLSMTSDFGLAGYSPGQHYAYDQNAIQLYGSYMDKTFYGNTSPLSFFEQALMNQIGSQDSMAFLGQYSGWDGGGFALSTEDMARVGLLMLAGGNWNGQQLLSSSYVAACDVGQIPAGAAENTSEGPFTAWNITSVSDVMTPGPTGNYSYGWWVQPQPGVYASDGAGGSFIIVFTNQNLVVTVNNPWNNGSQHPALQQYIKDILAAVSTSPAGVAADAKPLVDGLIASTPPSTLPKASTRLQQSPPVTWLLPPVPENSLPYAALPFMGSKSHLPVSYLSHPMPPATLELGADFPGIIERPG